MQLEESVTLFDDNKVENRFAELQITADGITSEVSRKVGNDEVISRINQSAESVKIQADKINIDGVITAVNDNTTTTIDGDKITTGTLNGDRIIANTVNGNRIIASTLSAGAINADSGQFNTANIPDLNASKITSGDILANRMSTNLVSAFQAVVSDLKALAATIGGFFIGDTDIHTKDVAITSNADNSVGLSSSVFTRTINGASRSNLKFAIGSKFGVDKAGTLYANGANVTSISADNISTGTINTSRLNANEIKTQIVQTTELNAGKITSGTLDTARLNANTVKSQIVQTAELNAGKITSGTLSADRIGVESIGANKIKVDEINIGAAQITSGTIETARIPNLNANKITSGTIDAARINAIGASSGAHASLTSIGFDISNGGTSLASFGTGGMRVGKEGEQRITVTSDTIAVYDVDGSNPFTVSTEGSLQTANNLWTNWVSGTSGSTYSRTANIYLKGNVENNRFYVAVSTSGEPTTFTQYIDNPTTTLKTLAINGVTFGIKKIVGGGVFLSMTSTTSTKKYAAFKWTEKYRVTAVKINDQVLSTRSQYATLIDSNGTSGAGTIYTYGNIAMLRLEVYKANVGSGGTIYQGRLLHHLPVTTVNLTSRYGGVCLGGIGSDGTVVLYNYTGATINPSASSPVVICATYIFK